MAYITPPRLATTLLLLVIPSSTRAEVEGDLLEEFLTIDEPQRAAWYWKQVLRSAFPMLAMRIRQPDWHTALFTMLIYAIPVRILDFLWAFVLSQVPLKEAAIRPAEFLMAHLALACACAIALQAAVSRVNVVWLVLASLLILSSLPAWLPAWFWLMLISVPPVCSAAFAAFRRKSL